MYKYLLFPFDSQYKQCFLVDTYSSNNYRVAYLKQLHIKIVPLLSKSARAYEPFNIFLDHQSPATSSQQTRYLSAVAKGTDHTTMLRGMNDASAGKVFLNRRDIQRGEVAILQKRDDNAGENAAASPGPPPPPPPPPGYKTLARVYVRRTGPEAGFGSGSNVEIKGWCNLENDQMSIGIDLPENTDFSNQNGGLGLLVAQKEIIMVERPAVVSVGLYEEGGFGVDNRQFLALIIDFRRLTPEIRAMYDGQPRTQTQSYAGYEGTVWWQLQGV